MLILLLREAKKLKVIHQKGFWSTVGNQFKGEKERPWKKDWAKVASEAGKDDRILRSFWKNIEPFLEVFVRTTRGGLIFQYTAKRQ